MEHSMQMSKYKPWLLLTFIFALLAGCSPINSLTPFDEKQAAVLIKEHVLKKPAEQQDGLKQAKVRSSD